ncbi:MAG: hypothetical protein ACR2O0_05410 [Rhizobiaceae bacterium]
MLIISGVLFFIFGLNVVLGSIGGPQFLGDLGELLVVIASVVFFVVTIIQRENREKESAAAESEG